MLRSDEAAGTPDRTDLIRWFISAGTLGVPQVAAPIAFALLALALTGDPAGGAGLMLAMTMAQVVGAVPITRIGKRLPPARYLQLLLGIRTLALVAIGLLASTGADISWLFPFAILAGSVNGAAYGYLRSILNQLTPVDRLPRALGIASTLNEVTFVLAPVLASVLGTVSPVLAVLVSAALGVVPALLVPHFSSARLDAVHKADASLTNPTILLWLSCSAAGGAAIAGFEIGAVALAISFGYEPALAILFTVPLCLASVAGGIWVSVRNRTPRPWVVLVQLGVMSAGAILAALQLSLEITMVAAVMIGLVIAPLSTHYSLVLDRLAPPRKRPEVFALLRTANALGIIFTSATLTILPLSTALNFIAGLIVLATCAMALSTFARRS